MKTLSHGDVIYDTAEGPGTLYTVGTVRGYLNLPMGSPDLEAAEQRDRQNGGTPVWANQHGTAICADPGYYEEQDKVRAAAIGVRDGEWVLVEGRTCRVLAVRARYNRNVSFELSSMPYEEFRTEAERLEQLLDEAEEMLNDTVCQHRSECAAYGDSWPGAEHDIDVRRSHVDAVRRELDVLDAEYPAFVAQLREEREASWKAMGCYINSDSAPVDNDIEF